MLSVEALRRADPLLTSEMSDEELEKIRAVLCDMAQLAFEVYWSRRGTNLDKKKWKKIGKKQE